ncbi:hypothetical protein EXS72_00650 [Candidatus Pacearchaeota archaeon]|nr:hypothetical protein [Candidatus Pacearchaeota archaeon]
MARLILSFLVLGIFIFAFFFIVPFTCAQTNSCILKSYNSQYVVSSTSFQGVNGQFPQTLQQIKDEAKASVIEEIIDNYSNDAVKCDRTCRGAVTSSNQHVICKATSKYVTGLFSYNCNLAQTECTASAMYTFSCICSENGGN